MTSARRWRLAMDCLGEPDPVLRDDIAFGALESSMRSQKLEPATLRSLRTTQLASLKQADAAGSAQPVAAIVLGEVANADRRKPFMSAAERTELVQAGAAYLSHPRDYRGYDFSAAEWDVCFSSLAIQAAEHDATRPQSMAHRHNPRSFLMTPYISLSESKDGAQRERLLPYVRRELKLDQR